MEKLPGNQFPVKMEPFQHPVSPSSETPLREMNDQLPPPSHLQTILLETSVENPFQDTPFDLQSLESGVARLNVSSNNRHSLYPSFDGGFLNGSIHDNYVMAYDPLARIGSENWRGNIVALAKDKCGCRFLQKTIDEGSREEIQTIFREVIHHVGDLMLDPFGNYVIQKIVEKGNDDQRMEILMMVTRADFPLINTCCDKHGARAVQKLLKHLKTREQISSFMSAINPGAIALIMDVHGHQVIRYCLEHFSAEDNKQILNEVAKNCCRIALDQRGCWLMKLCMERSRGEQREHLVNEIIAHAILLSEHCYATFVVQYILQLEVQDFTANLLRHLEGSYASLSRNKYGSHVVEECLIHSEEPQCTQIVMELLRSPEISLLLVDPYGNYVIQCALSVSKDPIFDALVDQVQKNFAMMCSNKYGKKVLAWLQDGD